MTEIVTIIPARGGSKGLKKENILYLGDKPLIAWAIEASLKSDVACTFVSTEDKEIKDIALNYGAEVIDRPPELSEDHIRDLPVFQHSVKYLNNNLNIFPNYIIHLRCDLPIRSHRDINRAIKKIKKVKADGLRSMISLEHPPHFIAFTKNDLLVTYQKNARERWEIPRQELEPIYRLHGIVDITKPEFILNGSFYGTNLTYILCDSEQSFDIHTEMELKIINRLLKEGNLSKWM